MHGIKRHQLGVRPDPPPGREVTLIVNDKSRQFQGIDDFAMRRDLRAMPALAQESRKSIRDRRTSPRAPASYTMRFVR